MEGWEDDHDLLRESRVHEDDDGIRLGEVVLSLLKLSSRNVFGVHNEFSQ